MVIERDGASVRARVRGRRRSRLAAVLIMACVAGGVASGCREPLLVEDERSPFDRYHAIRGDFEPASVRDQFGRRLPNLRGRLLDRR